MPGCAPGGAVTFSCLAKRKSPKRRRPCCARLFAALRATCDARAGGATAELAARCALRSNNCGESVHEVRMSFGTRTHPLPRASRHAQKGTRGADIHTGHRVARPSLRSAWRLRRRDGAEQRDGPCGCSAVHPLLAAPASGRLRGEHARRSAHASLTDSPWLSKRRCAAATRVPRRTPQPTRRRFAP